MEDRSRDVRDLSFWDYLIRRGKIQQTNVNSRLEKTPLDLCTCVSQFVQGLNFVGVTCFINFPSSSLRDILPKILHRNYLSLTQPLVGKEEEVGV